MRGQIIHQSVKAADGNCQPQRQRESGRMTNSSFGKHSLSISLGNYRTCRNLVGVAHFPAWPLHLSVSSGRGVMTACGVDSPLRSPVSIFAAHHMIVIPKLATKTRLETPKKIRSCWHPP